MLILISFIKTDIKWIDNIAYFIKEISPDRTELRLASNVISNDDLTTLANQFKAEINSSEYFQDFYLNFGSNNLIIANNILLDSFGY